MNSLQDLFKYRMSKSLKLIGKYSRLIFNDHLSIVLFGLIGFFFLAYQQVLDQLSQQVSLVFRLELTFLIVMVFFFTLQVGEPLWLNEEADDAYLFPRGKEWLSYWRRGLLYSGALPIVLTAISVGLLMPMIVKVSDWEINQRFILVFGMILFQGVRLCHLYLNVLQDPKRPQYNHHSIHGGLWVAGIVLASLWLSRPWNLIIYLLGLIVAVIYLIKRYFDLREGILTFDYAIQQSLKQRARFYKFVSLFANVPQFGPSIKRRKFLDPLFQVITIQPMNRYYYYYLRLMFRSDVYSGVWIRVTIFVSIMNLILKNSLLLTVILGAVGYWLTTIQLLPILSLNQSHPLQKIYPVQDDSLRIHSFKRVLLQILMIQTVLYLMTLIFVHGLSINLLIVLGLEMIVLSGILYIYLPFWIRKHMNPKG